MSCVLYSIVTSKVWYLMKLCEVDNSHRIYSHAKTTFAHVLTNNYVTRGDDSSLTTTIHHLVHPCGCVSLSMHVHTYIGNACIHVHQWVNMRLKKLMYANGLIMSLYSCSPIGRNNDIYVRQWTYHAITHPMAFIICNNQSQHHMDVRWTR